MDFNANKAREIIMNHYLNPKNKIALDPEKYLTIFSDTCSDKLILKTNFQNEILKEVNFDGHGCAIFMASTDIFLTLIKNKTKTEIISLINIFTNFVKQNKINEKEFKQLGDLWVFYNVKTHLNRLVCALLITKAFVKNE
ncbi:iron-sulfur cluster scaffold-like protein [Mycoplasmopsis cricetuli]|uniref:iron-sulfur cluster scaffold-like protein n=1 Tax=Mycoplasmopsis cricetuli TaxID=171283 RepID=UPI00046FBFD0|nr:iron-sulfur cluster scaffold-like protein [Mycoplasmopsis cricetuli]